MDCVSSCLRQLAWNLCGYDSNVPENEHLPIHIPVEYSIPKIEPRVEPLPVQIVIRQPTTVTRLTEKYFPYIQGPSRGRESPEESRLKGIAMHTAIEQFFLRGVRTNTREFVHFEYYNKRMKSQGYLPMQVEKKVRDAELQLSGCVDMLYVREGRVWIVDWKRIHALDKTGVSQGLSPFEKLPNCNLYKYTLQLNLYKFLLEKNYDMKVDGMSIVILHPENGRYFSVDVDDMQDLVSVIVR